MKKSLRLEIQTEDKMGVTLNILKTIYAYEISLSAMEVFSEKIYVKLHPIDKEVERELIEEMEKIPEVRQVSKVELMGFEEKERKLRARIQSSEEIFSEIIGNSQAILQVKKVCDSVARSDSTVLIQGESGTGKELFAKAIKNLSKRKENTFITVNCAAIPETLIESELFGYEKGSFTGALDKGKEGLFKEANGGTLFLDEIGDLPLAIQGKLLRVLQDGALRKIGSSKEDKVDVRIIAATNKNLQEMVNRGDFREDLYYRLNVIPLYIPPLRDRREDIPILSVHFIKKANGKTDKEISGANMDFINALMTHEWTGNVRELENVIERAVNLCDTNTLSQEHLIFDKRMQADVLVETEKSMEIANKSLKKAVADLEKRIILQSLEKNKSVRQAAKALGLSHTALLKKVQKYNIKNQWKI